MSAKLYDRNRVALMAEVAPAAAGPLLVATVAVGIFTWPRERVNHA